MKTQKVTGGYVKAENVRTGDLLTIMDEGEVQVNEYADGKSVEKLVIGVKLPNGEQKKLSLNGTSHNNLVDEYGDETANWIDKQCRVEVLTQLVGREMKKVVYITGPNKDLAGDIINA